MFYFFCNSGMTCCDVMQLNKLVRWRYNYYEYEPCCLRTSERVSCKFDFPKRYIHSSLMFKILINYLHCIAKSYESQIINENDFIGPLVVQ